jgi:hypothetical protein
MSIFKFVGNSRYFHPVCTSHLVYDNKDDSPKRIPCIYNTCVDPYTSPTGLGSTCRTQMTPSGYTGNLYTWGIEGSPWVLSCSYGEHFPYSDNEFCLDGGKLRSAQRPVEPTGNLIKPQNTYPYWRHNFDAYSDQWNATDPGKAGYQAMINEDLDGYQIDLSKLGGEFEPVTQYSRNGMNVGCGVRSAITLEPKIEYFTVGTDAEPPETNYVTFSHMYIQLSGYVFPYENYKVNDPVNYPVETDFYRTYWKNAEVGSIAYLDTRQTWISGIHPNPIESQYTDLAYSIPSGYLWNSCRDNIPRLTDSVKIRGANVYHPQFDYCISGVAPIIKGTTQGPVFHTGYRMQRYVQQGHTATIAKDGSQVWTRLRHLESVVRPLGYYAEWTIANITPTQIVIVPSHFVGPFLAYGCWAKATVVHKVSYTKFEQRTNPECMYEYGPIYSSDDSAINCRRYTGEPEVGKFGYNSPLYIWDWEVAQCKNPSYQPPNPSQPLPGAYLKHYFLSNTFTYWNTQNDNNYWLTHSASNMPSNLNDVLDPRSRQRINYYTWPLSWSSSQQNLLHSSYYTLKFDNTHKRYTPLRWTPSNSPDPSLKMPYSTPKRITLPSSPQIKFWRRLS